MADRLWVKLHRDTECIVPMVVGHRGQIAKRRARRGMRISVVRNLSAVFSVLASLVGVTAFNAIPRAVMASDNAAVAVAADAVILAALATASDGYSVDEVVINDRLRESFLVAIDPHWQQWGDDWQRDTLLRLLSLRKAGKIDIKATRRGALADENLGHVAEIAARSVLDQNPVSTDTLLCDPRLRAQLQNAAARVVRGAAETSPDDQPPGAGDRDVDPSAPDAYSIRKHLLRLRKTRQLRPELVLRVADWDRSVETYSVDQLAEALQAGAISTGAGVYLFYDATGYLYIGEAVNLRTRLLQHTRQSDRVSLGQYLSLNSQDAITVELHVFGPRSPAKELAIRRAYESELIRTRQPRFNVRP